MASKKTASPSLGPEQASGHCLCGAVSLKVAASPLWVAHCHCRACRRATASSYASYVGYDKKAVLIAGDDLGEFTSSPGVVRRFCKKCGSPIAFESEKWPGQLHLHLGVLDEADAFKAQYHVQCRTMLAGTKLADDLPRYQRFDDDPVDI